MNYLRQDHEPPLAIQKWGWKYHHLGIPTVKKIDGEKYLPKFKLFVSGFASSPYGIEWMRFEEGSPINELIKTVPHIAFEVDDLEFELARQEFKIIAMPNSPGDGVRVAMIEYNGAPIELIEFNK